MTATLIALLLAASPAAGRSFALDAGASAITYKVVHKLHKVDGTSRELEGKAVLQQDGRVLVMVRAPVASFRSGDTNRDAHMLEVLEAGRYPFVVFKGVATVPGTVLLAGTPAPAAELTVSGEVELHGRKNAVSVPLAISVAPDGTARAKGSFSISLDSFAIERPSLLFVKVEDACKIDVDLAFREVKP